VKKFLAYIQLMRPLNLFQGAIALLVTGTLMDSFPSWQRIAIAIIIVWSYTAAGNAVNDYCDAEIDTINRPNRPIPKGLISRRQALRFAIFLFILGSLSVIPIWTIELLVIMGIAMILLIAYSTYFKVRPFLGNGIVSLILGMAFLFAASIYGDIRRGIVPFFLAFGFNLVREIVKDIQDIAGDRDQGARTIPLKYGIGFARNMIAVLTIILMVGALLPYILNMYGIYYLLTLLLTVEVPLIYFLIALFRDSSALNCGRLSRLLKVDIFFGLLAIYLGRF
jgi:geranylgeranylglycerol-phosphate geranylgeranyltransferase